MRTPYVALETGTDKFIVAAETLKLLVYRLRKTAYIPSDVVIIGQDANGITSRRNASQVEQVLPTNSKWETHMMVPDRWPSLQETPNKESEDDFYAN